MLYNISVTVLDRCTGRLVNWSLFPPAPVARSTAHVRTVTIETLQLVQGRANICQLFPHVLQVSAIITRWSNGSHWSVRSPRTIETIESVQTVHAVDSGPPHGSPGPMFCTVEGELSGYYPRGRGGGVFTSAPTASVSSKPAHAHTVHLCHRCLCQDR